MLWLLLTTQLNATTVDCQQLYQQHLETDMKLTYQQFDQTEGSGFRPLAKQCKTEAVQLVKDYIKANNSQEDSLRWHIAQLLGELGNFDEAIQYAQSTIRTEESDGFNWNDYGLGYIAYWQNDIKTLQKQIETLESASAHFGNVMNANLLKTFLEELKSDNC